MTQGTMKLAPSDVASGEGGWRYGVSMRPIFLGTVPKGFVRIEKPMDGEEAVARHGVVVYSSALTAGEVSGFELVALADDGGMAAVVKVVVAELAEYAREYLEGMEEEQGFLYMPSLEVMKRCVPFAVHLPEAERFPAEVAKGLRRLVGTSRQGSGEPLAA